MLQLSGFTMSHLGTVTEVPPQTMVLDLSQLIAEFEQNPMVAVTLPWVSVQTMITMGYLFPASDPGASDAIDDYLEKLFNHASLVDPYFDPVTGTRDQIIVLCHWLGELMIRVDGLIQTYGQSVGMNIENTVFWGWLNNHTLIVGKYHDHDASARGFEISRRRAYDHIAQTTGCELR
jgi:hypothetical protein